MTALRCLIFNFLFYLVWTPFVCISMLPALLMPRGCAVWVSWLYQKGAHILEKYILGLDYEIRGEQYRPAPGTSCLIGCKHESAYETMKLYLLFNDPAIILKKELLSLPLFGWFLKKVGTIAIDRGNRADAVNSLFTGAHRVKDQKRPIVIFPQGTRVTIDTSTEQKPYKNGIGKLYVELNMPIVPVAINSGVFWPKNAFWKKPGKAVFEFLPPIEPGLSLADVMKKLESTIEPASKRLAEEALANMK